MGLALARIPLVVAKVEVVEAVSVEQEAVEAVEVVEVEPHHLRMDKFRSQGHVNMQILWIVALKQLWLETVALAF
jgi:hypothetical protein